MKTEIKIARPQDDKLDEMLVWLENNVGPGSMRTIKATFMGMDDWFYYENIPEDDSDVFEIDMLETDLVFTFRREEDATMFALKWTTQTA